MLTRLRHPAFVTLLVMAAYCSVAVWQAGGDPLALARLGTRYSEGDPAGSEGYDGQFVYYIARDLSPEGVTPFLDTPAYRYQRILLPLSARLLSFGSAAALPWVLAGIGLAAQTIGTALLANLFDRFGINRWYALIYGLWIGFLLAVRLDLPEPLAFLLVLAGAEVIERRPFLAWVFFGLAVFAKEVVLIFIVAQLLADLRSGRPLRAIGLASITLLPFVVFQFWLKAQFGTFGIGSGGANATPFEAIPFMGWLRIAQAGWGVFLVYSIIYLPFLYLPGLRALICGGQRLLKPAPSLWTGALFLHGVLLLFLPFSTVRETGGMLRFACGLILAVLAEAAIRGDAQTLRLSRLWLVLGAFIFNG